MDERSRTWRTSTRSGNNGACVEVDPTGAEVVLVRDSKDRQGPVLTFSRDTWGDFVKAVQRGEFAAATT